MYRTKFYFLIGFLIAGNSEKCDSFGRKVEILRSRNKLNQVDNIDQIFDLKNSEKSTVDPLILTIIENAKKSQILDRCHFKNPFFREPIKHRPRRSTVLSRLRSISNPILLPDLSKIFKKGRLIPKEERFKKEYPDSHYYPGFEENDSSSEEDDLRSIKLDYSPRSTLNTKKNAEEQYFSNYGEEYDPKYRYKYKEETKSQVHKIHDSESKLNLNLRKEELTFSNDDEEKSNFYEKKSESKFTGSSNPEIFQEKEVENSDAKRSIIKSVRPEGGIDLKNSDLKTKIEDKVVEGNRDLNLAVTGGTQNLIQMKHSLVDSHKALSDKLTDSAHQTIEKEAQLIDTVNLENLMPEEINSPIEETLLQKKDVPLQEKYTKPGNSELNTDSGLINEEVVPSSKLENPHDSRKTCEPWDIKSDKRNHEIIKNAVRKMKEQFTKMIEEATEDKQKRNNYDIESEIVDLLSNTMKEVVFSFSKNIPEAYFPGSSDREFENNFYDTRSNSGFDYVVTDPVTFISSNHEEPFYDNYPVGYDTCPKCNGEADVCLLGNKNDVNYNNNRHKRKSGQNKIFKDRGIILRPQHFFYDSTLFHIQDMRARPRIASYLRDDNKLHNLNIYSNNRFINLDANCSEEAYYLDPECQRLDYYLRTPKGANSVPLRCIKDSLSQGHDLAIGMHDRARSLVAEGLHPRPNTPSMLQFLNNKVTDEQVKLNRESKLTLIGTKIMQERLWDEYGVTRSTFPDLLRHHGFRVTANDICRKRRQSQCNTLSKYRNIDGSCNNLNYPTWGKSNTPFFRLLPPRYADGIHSLPISVTGAELPNPRSLSSKLFSRTNTTEPLYTLALMQWGQILAHDFAFQAIDLSEKNGVECCTPDGDPLPERLQHHSCAPIIIPSTDKFYASFGQRCMNFVRSMTVANEDCTLGAADQLNGATSFLDLSPLYGNNKDKSDSLRQFIGGRLKIEMRNGRHMMPTTKKRSLFCDVITPSDICYKTGDVRTNQTPQLIVLQTLLLREHNRIADALSSINPHWNDEKIFQETKRILVAMYQHITYKEWLPVVIGNQYCKHYKLVSSDPEMSYDYDFKVNPSTINGFTASAFRFLHSIVEGKLKLFTPNYDVSHTLRLSNHYFRPQVVEPNNNFEALLRGLIYQPIQKPDASFNEEITEYLFRSKNKHGLDLEAIDIQRGRDHGIPGYNAYRKICHLDPAGDFYDLLNEISWNNVEKLRKTYAHVDDIDLLVGATLEIRLPGSLLGPTLRCLIGEQFYRSRVGDKYFYDNADFPHSFTLEQFREIRKATLSRLICDAGVTISKLQLNSFKTERQRNPLTSCENLPSVNLNMWREDPTESEDLK